MDQNTKDLLETVIFIKDNMATKDDLAGLAQELRKEMQEFREEMQEFREEVKGEFIGLKNRMGGIDNRIDDEVFARKNLEERVRVVVPNLAAVPERG